MSMDMNLVEIVSNLMGIGFLLLFPLVCLGATIFFIKYVRRDAYVLIEYGYEKERNDLNIFPCRFTTDRNFLTSRKLKVPIPLNGKPIHYKGKPLYRFYSPEENVFVPMSLDLHRQILVENANGKKIKVQVGDLLPSMGFEAKQAFTESIKEAEKLYQERGKIIQMLMVWGPIIVVTLLMFLIIWQLASLAGELAGGINIVCGAASSAASTNTSVPFFR